MKKTYLFIIGFILSIFFTISSLMTAFVSMLDPTSAVEMVEENPFFSWMGTSIGYFVHIFGNMIFASIAIFFALICWKELSGEI